MSIPRLVDSLSEHVAGLTKGLVQTRFGRLLQLLVLAGPIIFVPTIWAAWTEPNIDALRTITWPAMFFINAATLLGLVHNGDWRTRLAMFVWIIEMAAVWAATLVR